MSAPTLPETGTDRVHVPGCDTNCSSDGCLVTDVIGCVAQVNTGLALEVMAFAYATDDEPTPGGYVELFPTEDGLVEGFFVSPTDARRLAAMLLDAADQVERLTGGAK